MPTRPHRVLGFTGLRSAVYGAARHDAVGEYNRARPHPPDDIGHFAGAVERLADDYGAALRPAYYLDEETDEVVQSTGHMMNINPAWEGDGLDDAPKDDAAWTTVTDAYDPVNADDAYQPLAAALEDRGADSGVFGAFTLYRNGGEVHGDVFVPALSFEVEAAGETTAWVPGIETGYSHYADKNVYAEPILLDPETGTVLRRLADRRTRRHVKPRTGSGTTVSEVVSWWSHELERLENLGDALVQTVQEAAAYTVQLPGPFGLADFYTGLGLPEDLADDAADLLVANTTLRAEPDEASALRLFRAGAHALSHGYAGKLDGYAIKGHFRALNDVLFLPPRAEERVIAAWRDRDEADQTNLAGDTFDRVLADRSANLPAAADEFRSVRDRLKDLVEGAEPTPEAAE